MILWYEVKIIDREEHWRIRCLKEAVYTLGYRDLLSRPSIKINTIWEPLMKKVVLVATTPKCRGGRNCWRSRDELIRDVLLWTPTHGRAKAGRPARTYIQKLCEDTGCCPEDLPRAMNDGEEWRERVRGIRATSATWWWWWMKKAR